MTSVHNDVPYHQNHENASVEHDSLHNDDQIEQNSEPQHDPTDDLALENAIGDAFKQFAMFGDDAQNDSAQDEARNGEQSADVDFKEEEDRREELDGGVGVSGEDSSVPGVGPPGPQMGAPGPPEQQPGPPGPPGPPAQEPHPDSDLDLEEAVGNLFSSLSHSESAPAQQSHTGESASLNNAVSPQPPAPEVSLGHPNEDPSNVHNAQSFPPSKTNTYTEGDAYNTDIRPTAAAHMAQDIPKQESTDSFKPSGESGEYTQTHQQAHTQTQPSNSPWGPQGSLSLPADTVQPRNPLAASPQAPPRASQQDPVEPPGVSQSGSPAGTFTTNDRNYANEQGSADDDDDDHDLENAIGDAFKNLVQDMNTTQAISSSERPESSHSSQPRTPSAEKEALEDTNLEDAIGEAFKSLGQGFGQNENDVESNGVDSFGQGSSSGSDSTQNEHESDSARPRVHVSQSFPETTRNIYHENNAVEEANENKDYQLAIDLGNIVQSVVSQMETQDGDSTYAQSEHSSIPKEVLQSLASEISNQVLTSESADHLGDRTAIHSTGVADSHSDYTKDDSSLDLDAALKAAVANAVKSAFPSGNKNVPTPTPTQTQTQSAPEKESDLDQLQMNEILQNAFNMAMHNPQELLTSLDAAEELNSQQKPDNEQGPGSASVLSSATALAALSAKQQLNQKEGGNRKAEPVSNEGSSKQLSIADTLALHRSNMGNTLPRDYSAIETLETPPAQSHPQLSTILSSLSQHIQSGTHSSNLMSVIRQMTNALMHNKKFPASFSKAGQEMIRGIKTSPEEKSFFIDCFQKTKRFILSMEEDENKQKASTLISNILESIDTRKQKNLTSDSLEGLSAEELTKDLDEDLPQYYDAAFSAITSLDITRLRLAIAGVKPELDSSEYKSRVREGNRERKKKWREGNAERNKDNDLRCRVLKRAALKFGESSSDEKSAWIEKEYTKRRNRRITRQKKDEARTESPPPSDDPPSEDPLLVNNLTDCFNIISECGFDDDPRVVLLAISAAISVASSSCAKTLGIADTPTVINSMTVVLNSIFETSIKCGASRKFVFLVKREDHQYTTKHAREMTKEELLRKIAALQALNPSSGPEISPSMSALEALRQSQKRLGPAVSVAEPKRQKTEEIIVDDDPGISVHQEDSSLTELSPSGNSWNSGTSLKMPSYRKPSASGLITDHDILKMETPRREFVEPIPKMASPFISNKLGNESSVYNRPGGFKKTGGLQRPVFSKPTNKAKTLGFPTLYSTSFRSN